MTKKPEWQDWPEEPWRIVDHPPGGGYSVMDKYGYAVAASNPSMTDARKVACVNALAGIRNPAAVGEVIEAARASRDEWLKVRLAFGLSDARRLDCEREALKLNKALANLDKDPNNAEED